MRHMPVCIPVQVFVKDLVGRTHTIDVDDENTTTEEMKLLVQRKALVPEAQQRLIFGGKQMEDGRVMRAYRLQRESTIHLVLRLRGD